MKNLLITALLAATLCACNKSPQKMPETRSVILTTPRLTDSMCEKHYSGVIHEAHVISLGFKTPGQIEEVLVKEGDFVRQGQLLARLDDADYRLGVDALQIQYDQLKDEVQRIEQLYHQKSISANDYEKATAGLKQLGVQLQVNKNKLDYTRLYAPTDGYIQSVNFSPAEMVDAGTALLTLLDVSHMEVVADIPVDEYQQRNLFARYYCRVAGIADAYPMHMLSLTPKADGNQLYQLRLTFAGQPDKRLTAGLNVEVSIAIADTTSSAEYTLPLSAVFRDNDNACVWVMQPDSTLSKRTVTLAGSDSQGRALIADGLDGNEKIVRSGAGTLQEGEKVRVVTSPSKTNVGGLL